MKIRVNARPSESQADSLAIAQEAHSYFGSDPARSMRIRQYMRLRTLLKRPCNESSHFALVGLQIITELHCSVHICGRVDVGLVQHGHHRYNDLLNAQNRPPPLICRLCGIERVHTGRVENRDANAPVRIDCRGEQKQKRKLASGSMQTLAAMMVHCKCPVCVSQLPAVAGHDALLGCHMGVMKRMTGGELGKSSGNFSSALKNPPSLQHSQRGEKGVGAKRARSGSHQSQQHAEQWQVCSCASNGSDRQPTLTIVSLQAPRSAPPIRRGCRPSGQR